MKKIFSKLIHSTIPKPVLAFLFPKKYSNNYYYNRFIVVEDEIAGKPFELYFRKDSFMEAVILQHGLYGKWEKESLKIWAQLAKKSQVILDIGANTGIFSMLAQNNNGSAKVIAIEPVNVNFEVLSKNIVQNKFKINAEKVALSDKEGVAKMFMLKDQLNYMTSVNDDRYALHPEIKGNTEVVEIEVPIKPFTYIFDKFKLDKIDLIKIDVEGHEITVLNAMLPYIEKYKPAILIEIIGDENAEILTQMFKKLNYSFISMDEQNLSKQVDKMWDNHHHNFLVCKQETVDYLRGLNLVQP
jgi:FkbM family methyltransferase